MLANEIARFLLGRNTFIYQDGGGGEYMNMFHDYFEK